MASDTIDEFMRLWDYNNPAATEVVFREKLEQSSLHTTDEAHVALLTQIARTYSLRSEFAKAHEFLDQAKALLTPKMLKAHVMYLLERGRTYNSAGKTADANPLFRKAFYVAEESGLENLAVDAAHMVAIADTSNANRWNLIAMVMAETSADPAAKKWLGSLYNNQGWTFFDLGEYDKALDLFVKSEQFNKQSGNTARWQIARWTVARTYRQMGRLDEALDMQQTLLQEVGDDPSQLGYIHEELGELLLLQDDPAAANHFKQAHDILSLDQWLVDNELERINRLRELGRQ